MQISPPPQPRRKSGGARNIRGHDRSPPCNPTHLQRRHPHGCRRAHGRRARPGAASCPRGSVRAAVRQQPHPNHTGPPPAAHDPAGQESPPPHGVGGRAATVRPTPRPSCPTGQSACAAAPAAKQRPAAHGLPESAGPTLQKRPPGPSRRGSTARVTARPGTAARPSSSGGFFWRHTTAAISGRAGNEPGWAGPEAPRVDGPDTPAGAGAEKAGGRAEGREGGPRPAAHCRCLCLCHSLSCSCSPGSRGRDRSIRRRPSGGLVISFIGVI